MGWADIAPIKWKQDQANLDTARLQQQTAQMELDRAQGLRNALNNYYSELAGQQPAEVPAGASPNPLGPVAPPAGAAPSPLGPATPPGGAARPAQLHTPRTAYEAEALQQIHTGWMTQATNAFNMFSPILTAAKDMGGEEGNAIKNTVADNIIRNGQNNPYAAQFGEALKQAEFRKDGTVAWTGAQLKAMTPQMLQGIGLTPELAEAYRDEATVTFTGPLGKMQPSTIQRDYYALESEKAQAKAGLELQRAATRKELEELKQAGASERQQKSLELRLQQLQFQQSKFGSTQQRQLFNKAVSAPTTALSRALQVSNAAAGFEAKLETNIATTKHLINEYVRKHPGSQGRIGGLISDLWEKKVQRSGDNAALYDHFASIRSELAKLESGSLGTAGVTKHAMEGFTGMSVASGLNNVNERLDNMLVMTHNARRSQETVTDNALAQVNSVRAQYGQGPLDLSGKATTIEGSMTPPTGTPTASGDGDVVSLIEAERAKLTPGTSKTVEINGTPYTVYRPTGKEGGGPPLKERPATRAVASAQHVENRAARVAKAVDKAAAIRTFKDEMSVPDLRRVLERAGVKGDDVWKLLDAAGVR